VIASIDVISRGFLYSHAAKVRCHVDDGGAGIHVKQGLDVVADLLLGPRRG
jgi:hypothetical protein